MDNEALEEILSNEKEWRRHIVKKVDGIEKAQIMVRTDIAGLKIKSGFWGIIGGLLAGVGIIFTYYLKQIIK